MQNLRLELLIKRSLFSLALVFSACASSGSARQPDWVRDPYTRYNRQEYIAVVGSGSTRQNAERNALSNLIAQFDQAIQVDERINTVYREVVLSGTVNWSEVTSSETVIALSSGIDTLVGAEIGEAWVDRRDTHYVSAILNRQRAARVYTDMVRANLAMIELLINIQPSEKYSLEGYSRFQLAATISDMTVVYGNLLNQIGMPVQGIRNGDVYRFEAAEIIKAIPVRVVVSKDSNVDRTGRIQSAFAQVLSELGFQSGGSNSRYVLDVNVTQMPVTFSNSQHFWSRIEVSANLGNATAGVVLLPFSFNSREGHSSQAEADNRAIMTAERRIMDEYAELLRDYLSGMSVGS